MKMKFELCRTGFIFCILPLEDSYYHNIENKRHDINFIDILNSVSVSNV
jgi:hypothetical protein